MKSKDTDRLVLVDLPEEGNPAPTLDMPRRISSAFVVSILMHVTVYAMVAFVASRSVKIQDVSENQMPQVVVTASVAAPASEAAEPVVVEVEEKKMPPPEKRLVEAEEPEVELPILIASLESPKTLPFPKTAKILDPVSDPDAPHKPSLEFKEEKKEETKKTPPKPKTVAKTSSAASTKSTTTGSETSSKEKTQTTGRAGKTSSARLVKKVAPQYPASARDRGTQGTVTMIVSISTSGRVSSAAVSKSSGSSVLDQAALAAVRKWKFAPALSRGTPVASRLKVPVAFRLR